MGAKEKSYRGETKVLNDETRAELPGEFVSLSLGHTRYEIGGPASGKPIVLIHGFTVPYFIWDPTFNALTQAGFRVLRYDLYGRGFSDRPFGSYAHDLYDQQLVDLLHALDFDQPVNVIGLSMGGVVAATFCARHPELVDKLTLIDPVGFPIRLSIAMKLVNIPGLGELIFNIIGNKTLLKAITNDFFMPKHIANFIDQYRIPMQYKGFMRAILSTLRTNILLDDLGAYEQVGQSGRPVLLLWGKEDKTVPIHFSDDLINFIPQTDFHPIEKCGHLPHYEKPEIVNPILIDFLNS